MCRVFQFCHCRNRNWVIFQSRRGPELKGVYALGFLVPGVWDLLDGMRGCCLCWHRQLEMRHQNGPSGNPPLHGSWEVSSSMFAQCRIQTSHDTCTPAASLMRPSFALPHCCAGWSDSVDLCPFRWNPQTLVQTSCQIPHCRCSLPSASLALQDPGAGSHRCRTQWPLQSRTEPRRE